MSFTPSIRLGYFVPLLGAILLTAGGCAAYATPGRAADLRTLGVSRERDTQTDVSVASKLDKRPLAAFPAALAVVRVQAPGYHSRTSEGWGHGAYSVVTTRDIESDESFRRLARLPLVNGVAPLNRLVLPDRLDSDQDLRGAAAALHADMLLIYTLDTVFDDDDFAKPLTVVSLGLFPNKQARVRTTASAVLMDTRNGYIYGLAEASARESQVTNAWQSEVSADRARRRTEAEAFGKLMEDFERAWGQVVQQYAGAAGTKPG